jgi:hypothetical protein
MLRCHGKDARNTTEEATCDVKAVHHTIHKSDLSRDPCISIPATITTDTVILTYSKIFSILGRYHCKSSGKEEIIIIIIIIITTTTTTTTIIIIAAKSVKKPSIGRTLQKVKHKK